MYCEKYKKEDFNTFIIDAVMILHDALIVTKDIVDKLKFIDTFLTSIEYAYNLTHDCDVRYKNSHMFGGGTYVDALKRIILYGNTNLMNILHETRHYIQFNKPSKKSMTYMEKEEDAREWSCSLYYVCFPDEYMKYVQEGKFLYV
jgi:hypothetical protein